MALVLSSDSAHYGVSKLASTVWGTPPDLVVSGPNIGNNLEFAVFTSGTM
jgi:broad specificity polyphosphatase/5'/3'-nucleotidase SurE